MKEITQTKYCIMVGLYILIINIIVGIILGAIGILNLLTFFIVPILSVKISTLVASINKGIIEKTNTTLTLKIHLVMIEMISAIIAYFVTYRWNIILFLTYIIGISIGHIISIKSVQKKIKNR